MSDPKHITEFSDGIKIMTASVSDFRKLPSREWDQSVTGIGSLVIVPQTKRFGLHDSGFRCMDFAAVHFGKAYCLLSGCSDVIHIGGISGFNNRKWIDLPESERLRQCSWSVDCLPSSGLLQVFTNLGIDVDSHALSSFEIWPSEKYPEKAND